MDYYGYIKALDHIHSLLILGDIFYFSLPIGNQRVEFDAHRVFSLKYLKELFRNKFTLNKFSFIGDKGKFHNNVPYDVDLFLNYGCGMFILEKI